MKPNAGRRTFLATCAMAGAAATRPLAAFGQAVDPAPQASSPSALRITEVKSGYVRGSLFVKITRTRESGGAAKPSTPFRAPPLVQSFGQRLRNQNPLNVHRIFEQIRKGGVFGGAQSGVFIAVLSAVETALWDLAGKALNVPVYQLLGGSSGSHPRVRGYGALSDEAARAGAVRTVGERSRQGRLYRREVRPRSGERPEQVRPVQLDSRPR